MNEKINERIKLLLLVWTVGFWGGFLFWFLVILGLIEVRGYRRDKFIPKDRGLILISNHPSLWDPVIPPFLFFPLYLFASGRIPISTPDRSNYYDKNWFFLLRVVCIPIERDEIRTAPATLERMAEAVRQGGTLILFPECGRTPIDRKKRGYRFSPSGKKIKRFPTGISRLFLIENLIILPIWMEGGDKVIPNLLEVPYYFPFPRIWNKVKIVIGEPIYSENLPQEKRKINQYLQDLLLELADQC